MKAVNIAHIGIGRLMQRPLDAAAAADADARGTVSLITSSSDSETEAVRWKKL